MWRNAYSSRYAGRRPGEAPRWVLCNHALRLDTAREQLLADGRAALTAPAMLIAKRAEPGVALPAVGVHDGARCGCGLDQRAKRGGRGVLEHLQANAP